MHGEKGLVRRQVKRRTRGTGAVARSSARPALAVAGVMACVMTAAACSVPNEVIPAHEKTPVITFALSDTIEHEIVTEIYAFALKREEYRIEMLVPDGTTAEAYDKVVAGDAGFTVVYTGDVLRRSDPENPAVASADVYAAMRGVLPSGVEAGEMSPAQDKPAVVVTEHTSETLGLQTMSDLQGRCGELKLAATPNIAVDPEIRTALRGYDCQFADVDTGMERPGDVVFRLREGTAGAGLINSTDPTLYPQDMITLSDDRELVPAQNLVPVFADGVLTEQARKLVDEISAKLTTAEVASINAAAESGKVPMVTVANAWLDDNGF